MKYKDIKIPEELMPEKEVFDAATEMDQCYLELYNSLRKDNKEKSPYDIVT